MAVERLKKDMGACPLRGHRAGGPSGPSRFASRRFARSSAGAALDILRDHKLNLERCIAANVARCRSADRVTQILLEGLTAQARRYLAAVNRDMGRIDEGPFGTAGFWGPNGKAPAIADIIRSSEIHRGEIAEEAHLKEAAE